MPARRRTAVRIPHGEQYTPEELWQAGNETIDAGLAMQKEGRAMKRAAETLRCNTCSVLIEIPTSGTGGRLVEKSYGTHELGCPEHYVMPE
jgi:hypothetical protein